MMMAEDEVTRACCDNLTQQPPDAGKLAAESGGGARRLDLKAFYRTEQRGDNC